MKIIGVDPGTLITGFGIIKVEGSTYQAIDYGCIRPPAKFKLTDRYFILFNGLREILKKYSPDALAVETQYVKNNVQSAMKLGMARCIPILAAKECGIPIFEYAPSQAKLATVGNGHASKTQVQKMVQLLLRLAQPPSPEDAADALAIAICHAHAINYHQLLEAEI